MATWIKSIALLGSVAILALGACTNDALRLSGASGGAMGSAAPRDVTRAAHDPMAIQIKRAFAF